MFNKIKGAFINAVDNLGGQLDPIGVTGDSPYAASGSSRLSADSTGGTAHGPKPIFALPSNLKRISKGYVSYKYKYSRPQFLQLNTDDEIQVSADQIIRPIIVPRDIAKLSWNSGYAEAINAGKSQRNEDQAAIHKGLLRAVISSDIQNKIADMVTVKRVNICPTRMMSKYVPPPGQQANVSGKLGVTVTDSIDNDKGAGSKHNENPDDHVKNSTDAEKNSNEEGKEKEKGKTDEGGNQDVGEDAVIPCSNETITSSSNSHHPENGEAVKSTNEESITLPIVDSSVLNKVPLNWNRSADDLLSPTTPLPFSPTSTTANETITHSIVSTINPTTTTASSSSSTDKVEDSLPYVYFGIFDGHAGSDVAVAAANRLHKIVHENLSSIADLLITFGIEDNSEENCPNDNNENNSKNVKENTKGVIYQPKFHPDTYFSVHDPVKDKTISVDNLITGALEKAFWDMDQEIERDKITYYMRGGCTALVAIFILGKLYVSNAGDSRAIVHKNGEVIPMSFDFTPASERTRIKYLGLLRPDFLGNDFTHLEFIRRPMRKDIGKELLYRDAFMTGWAYKTVKPEDLKFPLIYGEGKRSRVAATIGVTRGFGDHELRAASSDIYIKPFLTPQPEVKWLDLETANLSDSDVLIMGTDGLWDVTTNEKAAEIVQKSLDHFPANDPQRFKYRYISAAQDLVMHSRGKSKENGSWRTHNEEPATIDDISTFVIPLKPYQQEYIKWKEARRLVRLQSQNSSNQTKTVPTPTSSTTHKLSTEQSN